MKHIAKHDNGQTLEAYDILHLRDLVILEGWKEGDYYTYKIPSCNGCNEYKDDTEMRHDYHGIPTGNYCNDCYDNNYPYRRDDYTYGTGIADDGTPIDYNY